MRRLGYLKDSNAAAHSVDTGISQAVGLKRIENDIECPIYMLESNNYHQSIERTRGNVVQKMIITTSDYQLWFSHSKLQKNDRNSDCLSIYLIYGVLSFPQKHDLLHLLNNSYLGIYLQTITTQKNGKKKRKEEESCVGLELVTFGSTRCLSTTPQRLIT